MTMNRHTISWVSLTLLTALLILSGCKGRQAVTGRTLPPVPTDRIVENILAAQPQFRTMNISKADISLHYGNYDFTFRSSVKMVRDSIIAVSIQPAIGIEMFRIVLTPEGFTVIDKMNRRYAENPYEYLRLKYGIDVSLTHFQEMLSNRLFCIDGDTAAISERAFTAVATGDTAVIRDTTALTVRRSLFFTVTRDYRIAEATVGTYPDIPDVQARYADWRDFGRISFPSRIDVSAALPGKRPLSAEITVNKAEFGCSITVPAADLSKYKKVTLGKLLP